MTSGPSAPRLDRLELASGLVFGLAPRRPRPNTDESPLAALEAAIRPSLMRRPCLVSFSGGRDSSALLAVATALARREGHPLPVPVTNRFSVGGQADESMWQERVVAHLRLDDWVRLTHDDELDCVGPVATRTLLRHGLLWPFNAYFHEPLLRRAEGGSLLTGLGGDEMLAGSPWTEGRRLSRSRRRIPARDAARLAFALAPRSLRSAVLRRRVPAPLGWLRADAWRDVCVRLVRLAASEPVRWSAHVEWRSRLRYLDVATRSIEVLAADAGAAVAHPLLDPTFVREVAQLARTRRFADRNAAMSALFGRLLPHEVLARPTKACFDDVFWTRHARGFAAGWGGDGVDRALVDADLLRAEWSGERPDARSFFLAQAAWLAENRPITSPSRAGARLPPQDDRSAAVV